MKFGARNVFCFFFPHIHTHTHKKKSTCTDIQYSYTKRADLVAQAVSRLTEEPEVLGSVPGPVTFKKNDSEFFSTVLFLLLLIQEW